MAALDGAWSVADALEGRGAADALGIALAALALTVARFGALFRVFPLFTRTGIAGGALGGGIALAIALPVFPAIAAALVLQGVPAGWALLTLVLKEIAIGALLGLALGAPFWAAAAAGHLIDLQRDAGGSATQDLLTDDETTPLGVLLFWTMAAVFLAGGLFERAVLAALYESYAAWPPLAPWPEVSAAAGERLLALIDRIFASALVLGGPVVLALLLLEIGLAALAKFAPQINVFFLSMSMKTLLVLIMLPIYIVVLLSYIEREAAGALGAVRFLDETLR